MGLDRMGEAMRIEELKQVLERNGYTFNATGAYRDHKLVYSLYHNGVYEGSYTKRQIEYEMFGASEDHLDDKI